MRKSEICRLLSEKLEPKPIFPADEFRSVGGFWYEDEIDGDHQPADYFESEDASAKLLEAMAVPNSGICVFSICQDWEVIKPFSWTTSDKGTVRGCSGTLLARRTDRKTAIVLAAMKWLGIEGEISE